MAEETRFKDGKYWKRVGDKAVRIPKWEYDQINWQNAMESARPEGTGQQILLGASKKGQDILDAGIDLYARATDDQALLTGLGQLRQAEGDRYQAAAGMPEAVGEIGVEMLPYAAASGVAALPAGVGAVQQVGSQMLAAGITGGAITPGDLSMRGQQAGQDFLMTGAGAGVGIALERIINRVRGHRLNLTQQQRKAGEALDTGMKLSPGAVTGPGFWQRAVEPWIETAGGFALARSKNEELYQLATGRALGQMDNAIDLSAEGLGQQADEIGKLFNVLDGKQIKLSPEQSARLQGIGNLSEYMTFPGKRDYLTGNEYKRIRRQLSELAKRARDNPASPAGQDKAIKDMRKLLDLKFQRVVGKVGARKFKVARERWKILETIERGAALSPDGVIRPGSMKSAVNAMWGKTLRRAKYGGVEPETRDWLRQVNQQASQFTRSAVGSSGTAERAGMGVSNALLAHGAAGGATAGAYAAMDEDATPLSIALAGGAGAIGANMLLRNYGSLGGFTSRAGQLGQFGGPAAAGLSRSLMDDEP